MGKKCYAQHIHKDFGNKKVYVATSKNEDKDNVHPLLKIRFA